MKLPRVALTGTNLINAIGVVVIIYLLFTLGETIKRNYTMGRQINDLKSQMSLLEDQKDQLAYSIEYYKTNSFRDREARSKLGLQLPGENVVIIPHPTPAAAPTPQESQAQSKPQSNLQQWLDFLKGRNNS